MKAQRGFSTLVELAIVAVVAAGAIAALAAGWSMFTDHYREQGAEAKAQELAPLIEQCKVVDEKGRVAVCAAAWRAAIVDAKTGADNYAGCKVASDTQSRAVQETAERFASALEGTKLVLAQIQAAQRDAARVRLVEQRTDQAATPAATGKACDEARDILNDLSTRRMRFDAGRSPNAGAGANGDGKGPGAGALRISR